MKSRIHLNGELTELYQPLLHMGALVENALRKVYSAYANEDNELGRRVIEEDKEIDRLEREVEDFATQVIALEQPVATDLRELITATKIASELERIGDHARHFARLVNGIPREVMDITMPAVERMSRLGTAMVHEALTAFVESDEALAREVAQRDDTLDREHREFYGQLVAMIREHPEWVEHGVDLLFLNRYLERLGDHVTNICEWVLFGKTGEHVELNK